MTAAMRLEFTWSYEDDEEDGELFLIITNAHKGEQICVIDNLTSVGLVQVNSWRDKNKRWSQTIATMWVLHFQDQFIAKPDVSLEMSVEVEMQMKNESIVWDVECDYWKADYPKMNELISKVDWECAFANSDVNEPVENSYC